MSRRSHRLRWAAFGAASVVLGAFGLAALGRRLAERAPFTGVEWVQSARGPAVLVVEPGSPGSAAGLLPGDVVQSVNGRPPRTVIGTMDAPWRIPAGGHLALVVERSGATLETSLTPVRRRAAPRLYAYLAAVGLACFASGIFIVLRWPTVRGAWIYGSLGLAMFARLVFSQTGAADTFDWIVHWIDECAAAAAPALLIHLAWSLARFEGAARRVVLSFTYAVAGALFLAAVWMEGLGGAYRFEDPVGAIAGLDRIGMAFLAAAVVFATLTLGVSLARTTSSLRRSQLRWMLWGLGVGFGPFTAIYAVPWTLGDLRPSWSELGVLSLVAVPAAFTAAMARYRLHDLDLLLRRSLAAFALAVVTIATYAGALAALRRLVVDLELPEAVLGFLAALLTAMLYPRLRTWIREAVDRGFYRARYRYRATLLEWSRELTAETDLTSLLERLEARVRETLAVPAAVVLVRGTGTRFERPGTAGARATVDLKRSVLDHLERHASYPLDASGLPGMPEARHVFGMKVKGRVSALLAVAERGSFESPLSSEDRALLATLCAHAAAAIEAARLVLDVRQHAAEVETLKVLQERILESSGVGLLLVDAEGRIRAWNRRLEEIYGLPREEALGRLLSEVFPLHTIRRIERELAAVGPGIEARIYRHALVNRTSERIVVNVALSPLAADGGDGARVATFDDVTARVKLEEQVLQQERLASLGLLAAGVAHEVNTPLTGISSYAQILLEDLEADDPRRGTLEKIEAQTRRASSIANSLLNLARPERSAFEMLPLNDAVHEVVKLFEPQIRDKKITLRADLGTDLPDVRGHRGKLQQVLLNLLSNARDAVEGGGHITVRTARRDERVVLEVTDDGVGIADEDLPHIFDPFFTTKGRGKGTGLGLSISYGIVREHDGAMHVESVPGEFTRFRVDLPVHRPAQALA